jgi:hypothetical protein
MIGYSVVEGLKEQLMLRLGGADTAREMLVPLGASTDNDDEGDADDEQGSRDLGILAAHYYAMADGLCRDVACDAVELYMKHSKRSVDEILDPEPLDGEYRPARVVAGVECGGLPRGYVTSSLLDCFHYYGGDALDGARHDSNHEAHTDSGIFVLLLIIARI